nr:unnamed protein product [Callosobruchus analis]
MPYPNNMECAVQVEGVVRKQSAVPATIAIIRGKIHVGLSETDINMLGDTKSSKPVKTSRRDLAYVISNQLNGGTTVCGTILVAAQVGIPVFATGGIGGVHRGAEKTFDISADLVELGKCGVAVISSGVKSILDIPKTLEYLVSDICNRYKVRIFFLYFYPYLSIRYTDFVETWTPKFLATIADNAFYFRFVFIRGEAINEKEVLIILRIIFVGNARRIRCYIWRQ